MKNISVFLSENFQFWEVKFSIHLNRHVFVMYRVIRQANNDGPAQADLGIHCIHIRLRQLFFPLFRFGIFETTSCFNISSIGCRYGD